MLNKLFRKYNQNRKAIWTVIIMVAFFVILLQTIFGLIRASRARQYSNIEDEENELLNNNIQTSIGSNIINHTQNIENTVNQNNVSGSGTTNNNINNPTKLINQFIEYCNNNQIDKAYEMLSSGCKTVLFPSQADFQAKYVQPVFSMKRTAKIEQGMYGEGIYKVTYYANMLASGGYQNTNSMQDYMVVKQEAEQKKLSINHLIDVQNLNKISNETQVMVKLLQKQSYTDYEIYQIQITNRTNQTILVSEQKSQSSINLVDQNGVNYPSNIDEQAKEKLMVKPQETTILELKFNKMYNTNRISQSMQFVNIIANYEAYQRGEEVEKINVSMML